MVGDEGFVVLAGAGLGYFGSLLGMAGYLGRERVWVARSAVDKLTGSA